MDGDQEVSRRERNFGYIRRNEGPLGGRSGGTRYRGLVNRLVKTKKTIFSFNPIKRLINMFTFNPLEVREENPSVSTQIKEIKEDLLIFISQIVYPAFLTSCYVFPSLFLWKVSDALNRNNQNFLISGASSYQSTSPLFAMLKEFHEPLLIMISVLYLFFCLYNLMLHINRKDGKSIFTYYGFLGDHKTLKYILAPVFSFLFISAFVCFLFLVSSFFMEILLYFLSVQVAMEVLCIIFSGFLLFASWKISKRLSFNRKTVKYFIFVLIGSLVVLSVMYTLLNLYAGYSNEISLKEALHSIEEEVKKIEHLSSKYPEHVSAFRETSESYSKSLNVLQKSIENLLNQIFGPFSIISTNN
ncbi:hypothetical protein NEFER03_0606 [Nematocida sp. LUAm3]|nr:hypothetical protein NEFER03_0606 [Nematocida sp. LUAm3]KAI5175573.1 hypothetical protein NEFER02_1479 [Nematocida sp. LUAm2]KAI5178397.1 hypothetical protein NEFER01_1544 [Nematocida sp. LUAm1]